MVQFGEGMDEESGLASAADHAPQSSFLVMVIAILLGSGLCVRLPALLPQAAGAALRTPGAVVSAPAERALEAPGRMAMEAQWPPSPVVKPPPVASVPVAESPVADVLAIQGTMLVGTRHFAVTPTGLRQEGELVGSYRIQKIRLDHVSVVSGTKAYELDIRTGRLTAKE